MLTQSETAWPVGRIFQLLQMEEWIVPLRFSRRVGKKIYMDRLVRSPDKIDTIFERFFSLDSAVKLAMLGTSQAGFPTYKTARSP